MSEETKPKKPRVKRPKKSPVDVDRNTQIGLRSIIDENRELVLKNEQRVRNLNARRNREIITLDVDFFKKVYENIPLSTPITIENHVNIRIPKIMYNYAQYDLCTIDLNYYSARVESYRITYSNNWDFISDLEYNKIQYLNIIFKNFKLYHDDFITIRNGIEKKYNDLCSKIEVNLYYRNINDAENKLNKILDHLKFEPGLKYIFKTGNVKMHWGTKRWDYDYIKSLEIIQTSPAYCTFNVILSNNDKVKEYKKKKDVVLSLLKNEYTFEKNVERSKKIERLILESDEV